ncbi:GDP-mannose 4,6 dehydratase domain-containing protein [Sarocladium implicatum]|nr:GDP-mannose 4,6 dehydratase domain-containing protein [Sarocladium implicatum]
MQHPIFSRSASEYSLDGTPLESPHSSFLDGPFDNLSVASTPDTEHSDTFGHVRILAPGQNIDEFILVVGGLGYIGSHTCWELLKDGYNVVVIDDLSNSFTTVLDTLHSMNDERHQKSGSRQPELHFHKVDFRDQAKMETILRQYDYGCSSDPTSKIKGVIHFAAYKSVSESIENPLKYYDNNVAGLVSFCQTLSALNIKSLVFSSSATVYGVLADKGGRLAEELCTHTETKWLDSHGQKQTTLAGCTGLTNPYGRTKWMCEAILADVAVADPDWTVVALRYFNPVGCDESGRLGEDPRMAPTNLMPVVLQVLTGGRDHLDVYGTDWDTPDGTAIRDFIHVSDLARGHLAALSTRMTGFQTFNVGTGSGHSVSEVVSAMETASGKSIAVAKTGRRDGDVGMCVADPSKAMMELGWKPCKTLLDSCLDLCRFLGIDQTAAESH